MDTKNEYNSQWKPVTDGDESLRSKPNFAQRPVNINNTEYDNFIIWGKFLAICTFNF